MTLALLATNSRALWYATRGFGLVSLVLLTVTVVLGISHAARYARPGLPRFVLSALHKNASLLAVALLVIHIATAVLDKYASIRLVDAVVPFVSRYRPVWLGLGALAFDCIIALIVTSLLRDRLGYRTWRAVHWAAYASWPIGLVHALGTGSDSTSRWVLLLYAACGVAVIGALWWRLGRGWTPANAAQRGTAVAASIALPIAIAAWAVVGPLRTGWAKRSGTPASLIAGRGSASGSPITSASSGALALPITSRIVGTVSQSGPDRRGWVSITFSCRLADVAGSRLGIVLSGVPGDNGGVDLMSSVVSLGTDRAPAEYRGAVVRLDGDAMRASLASPHGSRVTADIVMALDPSGGSVSGTIHATG